MQTHQAQALKETVPAPDEDLLSQAETLFSAGMINYLKRNGLDIIEADSAGCFIKDIHGRRFLDCYSAASTYNLGRRNHRLTAALKAAAQATDGGNFVLISQEKAALSSSLAAFVSGKLDCVLFTVVRGEAMDAACKLARGYTGRSGLVSAAGGWYGHTGFAMGLSQRVDVHRYGRLIPDQAIVAFGDLDAAREAIGPDTAAFIIEPIQVENGCRRADGRYLAEIKALCERHGALLIYDETQTGFGRSGVKFVKDHLGVEPDILLFGEAITAGLFPMTGMVFTTAVKSFFDQHPLIHLCTFGGHDVGCRVALETLDLYRELRPWEDAHKNGAILSDHLNAQQIAYPHLVRGTQGVGLVQAITFNDEDLARAFCLQAKESGFLAVQGQVARDSVVLRPPLTISSEELSLLLEMISRAMEAMNPG